MNGFNNNNNNNNRGIWQRVTLITEGRFLWGYMEWEDQERQLCVNTCSTFIMRSTLGGVAFYNFLAKRKMMASCLSKIGEFVIT